MEDNLVQVLYKQVDFFFIINYIGNDVNNFNGASITMLL